MKVTLNPSNRTGLEEVRAASDRTDIALCAGAEDCPQGENCARNRYSRDPHQVYFAGEPGWSCPYFVNRAEPEARPAGGAGEGGCLQ